MICYPRFRVFILIIAMSFMLPNVLFAQDRRMPTLNDVLPSLSENERSALLEEGEILRFHSDGVSPGLLPETSLTSSVVRKIVSGNLNIGIEGLFYTSMDDLPAEYAAMPQEDRALKLYNILRSVSTLQGLEYYSASREEMRLLFEESWVITDPTNPQSAVEDPLVQSIPEKDSIYIHQKDKSFGSNESVMSFAAGPETFAAAIVNLTPIRYKGLIRVVNPENMQVHLLVVPVKEGLLMYGTMSAHTRNVPSFLNRARDSFTNRIVALTGWYRQGLAVEFDGS